MQRKEMNDNRDMTKGPVLKKIASFAFLLLMASLVQELYAAVDVMFAGRFIDTATQAAIGAGSLLTSLIINFFSGVGVGSGVVIASLKGSGEHDKLKKAIESTVALSLLGGIVLTAVGILVTPLYLEAVNTPGELAPLAAWYLRLYFLSLVFIVTYNLAGGVLRALGDSVFPLIAQLIGGLMHVALDYIFVRSFSDGIVAVAASAFISFGTAALLVLIKLAKLEGDYALKLSSIALHRDILGRTLSIGIPSGLQSLMITLSNVIAQSFINRFGQDTIAAFTAYFKVECILYLPIVAFGQALMTFVGQNDGAGDKQRVRKGVRAALVASLAVTAVLAVITLLNGHAVFSVFNEDENVIAIGTELIGITFPLYWIYCFLQLFGDALRGLGEAKAPMVIVMVNICLIRTFIISFFEPRFPFARTVVTAYPVSWLTTSVCMCVFYFSFMRKYMKEDRLGERN